MVNITTMIIIFIAFLIAVNIGVLGFLKFGKGTPTNSQNIDDERF